MRGGRGEGEEACIKYEESSRQVVVGVWSKFSDVDRVVGTRVRSRDC